MLFGKNKKERRNKSLGVASQIFHMAICHHDKLLRMPFGKIKKREEIKVWVLDRKSLIWQFVTTINF